MGVFEDLFDFDHDGKVGLGDDLMLIWLTKTLLDDKAVKSRSRQLFPLFPSHEDEIPLEVRKRQAAVEAESKARREMDDLYIQMLSIKLPFARERKEEIKEIQAQYNELLRKLDRLKPEDDSSAFYVDWLEMRQDFLRFINTSEEVYQILSGNCPDCADPMVERASEITQLEAELEEWEDGEPQDIYSDAWDSWDEKREELEEQLQELKEEQDWDKLMASLNAETESQESEDYQKAFQQASKILEETTPSVEPLQKLVQNAQRLIEEVQKAAQEQLDAVESAKWDLDMEEPSKDSPLWDRWKKKISELETTEKQLEEITYM